MKKYILSCFFLFAVLFCYGQSTYVYTKFGHAVEVWNLPEFSPSVIASTNQYYITYFPQATFLSNSSNTYNCHFYAWHKSDGGSGYYWMNAENNDSNIVRYWRGDYYGECTSNYARKIHYYKSDHSAVISSVSGMYESKWGSAPLMRHAPGYGPYPNMVDRRYYCKQNYTGLLNHNGFGETTVGATNYYTATLPGPNVRGEWDVLDARSDKEGFIENPSGTTNTIVFQRQGIYQLYYHLYLISTGEYVGLLWYEVLVEL